VRREASQAAGDVARAISERSSYLLVLHEFPDGDSLGSNLAMARALEKLGKKVTVASPVPPPERFSFLPGFERLTDLRTVLGPPDGRVAGPDAGSPAGFDCVLLIDCSDPRRAGFGVGGLVEGGFVINVDHHPSNTFFGHVNYVDPRASAAAEQVWRIKIGRAHV